MGRTLLLDNTFFPVKIISWQRAMILLLTGRAEVVLEYQDIEIHSVNFKINLPKILRLYTKHRSSRNVKFSRQNVFVRDNHTCQYCYQKFRQEVLTIDHVTPVSKGGQTTWENVVASCAGCNTKKGSKSVKEIGFKLLKEPRRPNWSAKMYLRLKDGDPPEWFEWFPSSA